MHLVDINVGKMFHVFLTCVSNQGSNHCWGMCRIIVERRLQTILRTSLKTIAGKCVFFQTVSRKSFHCSASRQNIIGQQPEISNSWFYQTGRLRVGFVYATCDMLWKAMARVRSCMVSIFVSSYKIGGGLVVLP